MLSFEARFNRAFRIADVRRYLPKWYWLDRVLQDRFGQGQYELRDYANELVALHDPTFIHRVTKIDFSRPMLVAPGNLLGYPNSELVFLLKESSAYADYWEGYPMRRFILTSPESGSDSDPPQDSPPSRPEPHADGVV